MEELPLQPGSVGGFGTGVREGGGVGQRGGSRERLREDGTAHPGISEQCGLVGPVSSVGHWADICWRRVHKTGTVTEGLLAMLGGSSSLEHDFAQGFKPTL